MLFITGTDTGVGKTWLTRGLARAAVRAGDRVAAIKPIETGCEHQAADAIAIARACGRPELANAPGLFRARAALAPYAATLEGEPAPNVDQLAAITRELAGDDFALIEGAGGLLTPVDRLRDVADLAAAIGAPVVLVARDALGVLSQVRAAFESADARGLAVVAIVLTETDRDPSTRTNRRILEERLSCPILFFPRTADDDEALADAAEPLLSRMRPGP